VKVAGASADELSPTRKTASQQSVRTLGTTIALPLLARADEVIE
jgi:hypothetical protein